MWVIQKWSFFHSDGLTPNIAFFIFLVKIGFGFLLFAIYYFYYGNNRFTSDAFRFYDDSLVIYETLKTNPSHYFRLLFGIGLDQPDMSGYLNKMNYWTKDFTHGLFNDNQTIIRINSLFDLFSFGYYHVHTVFMCFISLIGLTAIYKAFIPFLREIKLLLIIGVFLIPSVLFWGSGVLKEGVVLFAMGLLLWGLFNLMRKFSVKHAFIFVSSILLLLFIKVYVIIALTPCIIGYALLNKYKQWNSWATYLCVIVIGCLITLSVHNRVPQIDIITKLHHKQFDFINMTEKTNPGSGFYLERLNNNPIAYLKAIPTALINSTFRPFLWESKSPLMLYNSIGNIVLFFFGVLCLLFKKRQNLISFQLVGFCFVFILLLYLFIGWTTPISGAIVRYKILAWPFFIALFLLIVDEQKLYQKLPFLSKLNAELK
ncbi:MAG: hypothetical protein JKY42_03795 [Flavobacteriales bacterium]|nr:hypothetical protein [Flavobacteriales bacterium]